MDNIPLTKITINRLIRDVKNIKKNPLTDNGIYYQHDDTDVLKGYALIIGPEDTPYSYGNYLFELTYPTDYPASPPVVKYLTNDGHTRFNPNLYRNGKVCISVLNTWRGEGWSSCQSISSILLVICSLLNNEPLLNEPGVTVRHKDYNTYNKILTYKNIEIAILKIINKESGYYYNKFDIFYDNIKENFIKNYDKIMEFLDKNKIDNQVLRTTLYNMTINVDYNKLDKELKNKFKILNKID